MSKTPAFFQAPPKPVPENIISGWASRLSQFGFKEIEARQASNYIFSAVTYEEFLNHLFKVALGRKPDSREKTHYFVLLSTRKQTRTEIANLVFTGEEASRHIEKIRYLGLSKLARLPVLPPSKGAITPDSIRIPTSDGPVVSVVIPIYGKVEYTLHCLDSIAKTPSKTPFEVLVIDDFSPDDSLEVLSNVEGIRLVRNEQNLGFVRTCNYGATLAKGKFLHFLNNDTTVKPGWLDELVATFSNFESTAIVGSKLSYPDGSLQEAGAIVWRDGSAWNYGKGEDLDAPQYNYARIADYVSGASLMVSREFFESVSGFDERYAPAYYEDTDLCFQARAKGFKVVYQPLSQVVHYEGVSSGSDLKSGTKAYQVVNMKKFTDRWADQLTTHKPNGVDSNLERDRGAKGRVLFIDACTPTPDQDSGSIDIYNLMKVFVSMGWAVSFIPEDNYAYTEKYTPMMQAMGVQMLFNPYVRSVDQHISAFGEHYDLVMLFRPKVTAKHIDNIRQKCPKARVIFNTVDLHFLRLEREGKLKKDKSIINESERLKGIELELMRKADLTTVVSSAELDILKGMGVSRVVHLPFSREIRPSNVPFKKRRGLLFVGGFQHAPNVDAIRFFVDKVMPLLRQKLPDIVLHVVGSKMPSEVSNLASADIVMHGFVEDLTPLLDSVRLNIAPLRYGAGTKGKVIHAMANSLPTVGTSIAFEGMGIKDGVTGFEANDVTTFLDKIVAAYSSQHKWNLVSKAGLIYADKFYGLTHLRQNLISQIIV